MTDLKKIKLVVSIQLFFNHLFFQKYNISHTHTRSVSVSEKGKGTPACYYSVSREWGGSPSMGSLNKCVECVTSKLKCCWDKWHSACRPKRPLLNNPWYPKFPTRPPWGRGPPILRSITLSRTARANSCFPTNRSVDSLESPGTYLAALDLQGGKNHRVLNQQCLIV